MIRARLDAEQRGMRGKELRSSAELTLAGSVREKDVWSRGPVGNLEPTAAAGTQSAHRELYFKSGVRCED